MVLMVQFNLGRGFLGYLNDLDAVRLDRVAEAFAEQYEQTGDWTFAMDRRTWRSMTRADGDNRRSGRQRDRPRRGANRGPGRAEDRGPESARERRPRRTEDRGPRRGPARRGPRGGPLEFGPRVALFDAQGSQLMGRPVEPSQAVYRADIQVNNERVGWLTVRQSRRVSNALDLNFLQQQSRGFVWIGLGLLLLTGLLALLFSRHLTRPLTRIAETVQRMAGGQYQDRIAVSGSDELSGLSRDINTLAQSLEANQEARQHWIADISHELRTPLAIMRGELEAMKDGVRPINENAVDSLHAEAMRLSRLVDDLHQLSLSDAGALNYDMARLDISRLLTEVVDRFSDRMIQAGLSLQIHVDGGPVPVYGDQQRLMQLLTNLLENSLRYTDRGGVVRVALSKAHHQAQMIVEDSAPGVPAESLERLFDRLFRLEESRNRQRGGSGLGLSICRNIVQAHEGSITAGNSSLGGLKVTVALPLQSSSS